MLQQKATGGQISKNTMQGLGRIPRNDGKVGQAKLLLKNMVKAINEKDEHLQNMKKTVDLVAKGGATEKKNQLAKEASSDDDSSSEVLSMANWGQVDAKKTEAQKSAEMKSLVAFIIECERRKIVTK